MENVTYLHRTVYEAYAPHKEAVDNAVHTAAATAACKVGLAGFAAAFSKLQLIAKAA